MPSLKQRYKRYGYYVNLLRCHGYVLLRYNEDIQQTPGIRLLPLCMQTEPVLSHQM